MDLSVALGVVSLFSTLVLLGVFMLNVGGLRRQKRQRIALGAAVPRSAPAGATGALAPGLTSLEDDVERGEVGAGTGEHDYEFDWEFHDPDHEGAAAAAGEVAGHADVECSGAAAAAVRELEGEEAADSDPPRPPRRRPLRASQQRDGDVRSLYDRLGDDGDDLAGAVEEAMGPQQVDNEEADDREANMAHDWFAPAAEAENGGGGGVDEAQPDDALVDAAPAAAGGAAAAPVAAEAAPQAPMAPRLPRVDAPDGYKLFGDVPESAKAKAKDNFLAMSLRNWARNMRVRKEAVTGMLRLYHGEFGTQLGVKAQHLVKGGAIPLTAKSLYSRADEVGKDLEVDDLLSKVVLPLPENCPDLVACGTDRTVEAYRSNDIAKLLALPLMNPELNSRTTPFHYEHDAQLPAGYISAGTSYSADEKAARAERIERGRATLASDIAQYPGMTPDMVGVIAVGTGIFTDSITLSKSMSRQQHAVLVHPTCLHPSVMHSPQGVAVAGLWSPPGILKATKVAGTDVSLNASPATVAAAAQFEQNLIRLVVAEPLEALFRRGGLIVRAKHLPGLPADYPYQYVSLVFYPGNINADAPELALHSGLSEGHCPIDGTCGADIGKVPATAASGYEFSLPAPFVASEIASRFRVSTTEARGSPAQTAATQWLKNAGFSLRFLPMLVCYWSARLVPGAADVYKRIIYDPLHCFFVGLLPYFLDALILIILNSHPTTEAGNKAVALLEMRMSSVPAFNSGYRLYRAYRRGYGRRSIFSGNDRFYFLVLFASAIGMDDKIIPNKRLRAIVLAAVEAAMVLAHLLRAEALTAEGRQDLFNAARTFATAMLKAPFVDRQKSHWVIFKFHMLFHLVNWVPRGAPACTNSSKYEAALKYSVSTAVYSMSNNQDVQRDIAASVSLDATINLLRFHGGDVGAAVTGAATKPARRQFVDRATGTRAGILRKPLDAPRFAITAVVDDWATATSGAASGADVDVDGKALWYETALVWSPNEHFVAPVSTGAVVELNPCTARIGLSAAEAEHVRDDPALARLARVRAFFYLRPPSLGQPSDGLPLPAAADIAKLMPERMFVLVHRLLEQSAESGARLKANGFSTRWHTLRHVVPKAPGARFKWEVFPLASILRAVRVLPSSWPAPSGLDGARLTASALKAATVKAAACRTGSVLVFWEPRRTFLPMDAVPAVPEGAAVPREPEEDSEEE